ncbi:MAG: lipase maturation factor family protein [Candidatus Nanosalina sp.]
MISSLAVSATWLVMWFLFLSFVNTGQKFYEHGWELILLEAGFLAIFLGGLNTRTSEILIWLFRWILFRMMLGSGLIKLHGDRAWKDLSALKYHYETQPFPNPLSWYLDRLPEKILETGVLFSHFMLLVVPFLYFAPQPYAAFAGVLTVIYQVMIFAGGNYAWLNLVTAVLAFSTFSDGVLISLTSGLVSQSGLAAYPYGTAPVILAGFIALLSLPVLKNMFSEDQVQNRSFDCLHLVNSYGAFVEVPRERKEIVLECLEKKEPDESDWEEIRFHEKPDVPGERPRQVSPYLHRLDYPFWFTARNEEDIEWLESLLEKLLSGGKKVQRLFREVPVEEPERVRARIFSYRFTSPSEKEETGNWWVREPEKILL